MVTIKWHLQAKQVENKDLYHDSDRHEENSIKYKQIS